MSQANNSTTVQDKIIQRDPDLLIKEIVKKNPSFDESMIGMYIRNAIRDNEIFDAELTVNQVNGLGGEQEVLLKYFTKVNSPDLYQLFMDADVLCNIIVDLPNEEYVTVYISNEA